MQCPRCQHENSPKATFCEACGTPLAGSSQGGPPAASPADLQRKIEHLTRALNEALKQQTATAEILRVISSSPTDLQPVLVTVAENAARVCGAIDAQIYRVEGEFLHWVASHGPIPPNTEERLISRGWVTGRAVVDRRTIHVHDLAAESDTEYPVGKAAQRQTGHRTTLATPLLRAGVPVGVISIRRMEVRPFSEKQVRLLQTFADQAVIAIENVRLFNEMNEALERQTATSEILRVISSSPTDVAPVFATIVRSAVRLSGARRGALFRFDGELVHLVAHHNQPPEALESLQRAYPMRLGRAQVSGRAILSRAVAEIQDVRNDPEYLPGMAAEMELGSLLGVPMLRADGEPSGAIVIQRSEVGPFAAGHVKLLETFADQAVIAIENVRLFTELEVRNRDLTMALGRQTATSEILSVISTSPTDTQPVFNTIIQSAVRLLSGFSGIVTRLVSGQLQLAALTSTNPSGDAAQKALWPKPLKEDKSLHGQVITALEPRFIADVESDPSVPPGEVTVARARGYRSIIAVPLVRNARAVGSMTVTRRTPGPFSDSEIALLKTFAAQAVIAVENVRLFTELQAKNQALTEAHDRVSEALEQQTATAEILRVISSSPTDVQPVFDAIARSAVRLCDGLFGFVGRFDGEQIHLAAYHNYTPEALQTVKRMYPMAPSREQVSGRVILTRAVVHIEDVLGDPEYAQSLARAGGWRGMLGVPLLRESRAVGVIVVIRGLPGPFSKAQIELLKTFADQAVIAIENVRLFTELQRSNHELTTALEQQTATGEILRVISSSPTDEKPVFDAIARSSILLCGAAFSVVAILDAAEMLHLVASEYVGTEGRQSLAAAYPMRPNRGQLAGRAILDRAVVHVPDVTLDPEYVGAALGNRATLSVPMLRQGIPIGTITIGRFEPLPFSDQQIELLQIFADQAVIAIENVRLFKELEARNRDLTEALDQQTATAEILRVISQSQTDVQPVFDAILGSAVRLLRGYSGVMTRLAGDQIELAALTSTDDAGDAATRAAFPQSDQSDGLHVQATRDRAPINITDAQTDPRASEAVRANARARGNRSWVIVPLLRHDEAVGTLAVTRREPGGFTDDEIALLKTFADQAVIAIENARLLTELQARTQELSRSVGELQALGEVGQAISSTLDLETVLTTIVSRAVQLSALDGGVVFEYDEGTEEFVHRAGTDPGGALAEARRTTRVRKGEGVLGRTAITLEPIQVPDITVPAAYEGRLREILVESGVRAILAVPMVREGRLIGCLGVTRNQPGEFPAETIELLRTFATQSALAIQNARLFHEIADKSRQLEAASRHKSEFLANMSHELRTPLNAIIGFSEVLAEKMFGDINDKQAEYLQDILESGRHLLSLINDILDLSKIEAGRMELELAEFDLPQAIENALTLVRERALRRGIALHHVIHDRVADIRADERKVKQVLLNLLSNAIKFTPEGGRIDVRAAPADGLVEVSVTDSGIGIAPEDQEAVFEEFRQVGATDKKAEGTGLGLALSRRFIELHGGQISVQSEIGHGSTFTFTLPVRP